MAVTVAVSDAVVVEQVHVAYGSTPALDGVDLRVAPGGTLAVLGHNGAGKTSSHPGHDHLEATGPGPRRHRRRRRHRAPRRGAPPHRGHRPVRRARRLPHDAREPRAHRSPGRPAGRGPRPRRRSRRPVRAARHRRPPGGRAVGRDTAPGRSRRQPGRLTGRAVPRRAHHRARPRRPPGAVGGGRRAHRRRHHGGAHHPIPRRGRPARRPRGRPRPRPHRRPGHAGRAQDASSAARSSGPPSPRTTSARCPAHPMRPNPSSTDTCASPSRWPTPTRPPTSWPRSPPEATR